MNPSSRRLNALGRAIGIGSYLEIGGSQGTASFRVGVAHRTGLDAAAPLDGPSRVDPGIEGCVAVAG